MVLFQNTQARETGGRAAGLGHFLPPCLASSQCMDAGAPHRPMGLLVLLLGIWGEEEVFLGVFLQEGD